MSRCAQSFCDCLRRTFCWDDREGEQDDTFDELLFVPGEERDQVSVPLIISLKDFICECGLVSGMPLGDDMRGW